MPGLACTNFWTVPSVERQAPINFLQLDSHQCCHTCQITHEFGNMYRCASSGQVHVCDSNCAQRIPLDRYSYICKLSRKLFPISGDEMMDAVPSRKRDCGMEADAGGFAGSRKRAQFGGCVSYPADTAMY